MMTDGQRAGKNIAEKMCKLQDAFRAKLNMDNYYFAKEMAEHNREDYAAENMAKNKDFLDDELLDEMYELAIAVLDADVVGMYYAGFVESAGSYEEYRTKEKQQVDAFYKDLNREIAAEVNKTPAEKCNERIQSLFGDFENWGKPITEI